MPARERQREVRVRGYERMPRQWKKVREQDTEDGGAAHCIERVHALGALHRRGRRNLDSRHVLTFRAPMTFLQFRYGARL